MITPGSIAPRFGCSAWRAGRVRRLSWSALHTGTLLLLFDEAGRRAASYRRRGDHARLLNRGGATGAERGAARLAVVCHGPLDTVERWDG